MFIVQIVFGWMLIVACGSAIIGVTLAFVTGHHDGHSQHQSGLPADTKLPGAHRDTAER